MPCRGRPPVLIKLVLLWCVLIECWPGRLALLKEMLCTDVITEPL